jgi:hypothetical protein
MTSRRRGPILALATSLLVAHVAALAAEAHGGVTVGAYELEVSWRIEPAFVGQPNAVQVSITESATLEPVTDLAAGDLTVTISPIDRDSSTHALVPAFDLAAGTGVPGTYEASFVPAVAGDHTFHVTGSIHGTAVDFTLDNVVDAAAGAQPGPDVDPLVLVGGAVILLVVAGMAFLLFRVRSAPPGR